MGAIAIGVLFTVLFGGLLLALVLGYRNIEENRALLREDEEMWRFGLAGTPASRIRGRLAGPEIASASGSDEEAMVRRVQSYIESEQSLADQFVSQPSVESLYRESGKRTTWN